MSSGRPPGRRWLRAAAVTAGLALMGAGLLVTPASGAQAAAPAPPEPDVLAVDFAGGAPTERVSGMAPTTWGAPTYGHDADLGVDTMRVDGQDDAVSFAAFADEWPRLADGFTVECVFRIDRAMPVEKEMDLCSDKEAGGVSIYVNGANLGTMAHIGGGYKSVLTPIDGGRWYHVLSVWDGADLRLYLNGALAGSTPATGALTVPPKLDARHLVIGGDASPGGVGQLAPPSTYAAASVFGRAVTAEEAGLLAGEWPTVPQPPAADVLDVDLADGTPGDDAQGLTLTRFGDPQIGEEEALGKDVATFDGSDDAYAYAFGDEWAKLGSGFALECTFRFNRPVPVAAENAICSDKEAGGFATVVNSSGLTFMAHVGGGYKSVKAPLNAGQWYHTLATWDGSTISLYVDGELVDTTAAAGALRPPSGIAKTAFMVGADTNPSAVGQFWAASTLATVRVFGRPLTDADALALSIDALGEVRNARVELVSTVPASGARVTSPVEFEAEIRRQSSATGWRYELDGEPIQPGQRIGAGLTAGTHEITVSATDVFGKALSWSTRFTSPDIPRGDGTATEQGAGRVTLSSIARGAGGGDVTTTFKAAGTTTAEGGFQGVVPVLPTTLDFAYDDGATLSGRAAPDGRTTDSPSTGRIPFQRYDLTLRSYVPGQQIVWSGIVDPERTASLRAWNPTTQQWVQLASARGTATGDTVLAGAVRPGLVADGVVHVLVTGEDPFADDLSPRDASAQKDKDGFERPEDYDFSMVHFTDTQYLAEGAAGGTYDDWDGVSEPSDLMTLEEQAIWQRAYRAETEWIRDNADKRKIAYTAHTGDVIENDYYNPLATDGSGNLLYPGLNEQVDREFAFTSEAQGVLDDAGLVNQVVAGNHDNQLGAETGPDSRFSRTFSAERYYAAAQRWPDGASFHTWDETTDADGNVTTPGRDSQNNYVLFSAGGLDFVAVGLSYGVTPEEAAWATSVFERYHDRNGILLTHAYLAPSTAPDGRGASFSADGSRLFQQVVAANPNVFLVLAGHEHGVGTNLKTGVGATVAHNVVELLADYQFYRVTAGELFPGMADAQGNIDLDGDGVTDRKAGDLLRFGSSYMRMLQFDVERSEVHIDTYSPFLDDFGATEYDDRSRYNGAEDNLTLPVDLSSRTTSFATDGLTLVTPGEQVIGEATARSGWPATVTWDELVEGEVYAWTATSRNASGDEIGTVDQFGGVFVATARGTDVTAPRLTVPAATTLTVGDPFDPMTGVRATDDADGDVTDRVQVAGSVDTAEAGVYALSYLASDTNGNQTVASRTVTVRAVPEPERTATSVSADSARVAFGDRLTLTATVSPAVTGGSVDFMTGEEVWCSAPVVAGRASCVPATLPPPGTYVVEVAYTGDARHATSSDTIAVVVEERSSSLRARPVATTYGEAKRVRVEVPGVDSGTVTLRDGRRALASAPVADGVARVRLPGKALEPGRHRLTATYSGPGTVAGSSTELRVRVAKVPTRVAVSARKAGPQQVRVTVRVTAGARVTPTGTVSVRVGARTRTVTLHRGTATVTIGKAGRGRARVVAKYDGDALSRASAGRDSVVLSRR